MTNTIEISRELAKRIIQPRIGGLLVADAWRAIDKLRALLAEPPLIHTLHANGELIAMETTIAQQAQMLEDLKGMKDLSEVRAYHAQAQQNLLGYADAEGMRPSDVKHYRKRAEFHARLVARIDAVAGVQP